MPLLSQAERELLSRNVAEIDESSASGLAGAEDSLAYRLGEIERHLHVRERWWGALAGPDETNAIEANVTRPFVVASGNDAWGTAIPILGTADDPVVSGSVYFDPHRILFVDFENATAWRFRLIWGTGTSADAITAGQWSEIMIINAVAGPFAAGVPGEIKNRRVAAGTKLWAQAWNATNLDELDFFWGAHGYEG